MDFERDLKLGDFGFGDVEGMGIKLFELNMGFFFKLLFVLWDFVEVIGFSFGFLVFRKNCGGMGFEVVLFVRDGGMLFLRSVVFFIWNFLLRVWIFLFMYFLFSVYRLRFSIVCSRGLERVFFFSVWYFLIGWFDIRL